MVVIPYGIRERDGLGVLRERLDWTWHPLRAVARQSPLGVIHHDCLNTQSYSGKECGSV